VCLNTVRSASSDNRQTRFASIQCIDMSRVDGDTAWIAKTKRLRGSFYVHERGRRQIASLLDITLFNQANVDGVPVTKSETSQNHTNVNHCSYPAKRVEKTIYNQSSCPYLLVASSAKLVMPIFCKQRCVVDRANQHSYCVTQSQSLTLTEVMTIEVPSHEDVSLN
jgi:hypothetical protein